MNYYTDLFSPETYEAFSKSDRTVSGFRPSQENAARKIEIGDKLVCYITKLSRWMGMLEVTEKYYIDNSPVFYNVNDPFIIRFKVKPVVWLPLEKAIPIKEEIVFSTLSFTKDYNSSSSFWTGKLRNSLNFLDRKDGKFLENMILSQAKGGIIYEYDREEYLKLLPHRVNRIDKTVTVIVPEETSRIDDLKPDETEVRESIRIQAKLSEIGAQMGLKIWIPRNDRQAVLSMWKSDPKLILNTLPLNYDETTIKTIEQIDVIWLKGRAIVRAFEVEHTTSIYSGILRMADLLALQPNMNIKLHIVAPVERREKVFQEIKRPVFSLIEEAPLSERCTYISYNSVKELAEEKHLSHLSDSVVDEYSEEAE